MAAHLKDLDAPVSNVQIMSKILHTLPPSYRHFYSAWDSVPKAQRTIKLLTSRLVQEEARAKQYPDMASTSDDAAFLADNQPTPSNPPAQGNRGRRGSNRGGRGGYRGGRGGYKGSQQMRLSAWRGLRILPQTRPYGRHMPQKAERR